MRATIALLLIASLATGCRAPEVAGPSDGYRHFRNAFDWQRYRFSAEVFYDDVELDEIELEEDLEDIFGDELRDVDRKRAGVRVGYGVEEFRFFGQIFGEDLDDDDQSDLNAGTSIDFDDFVGIGGGVAGEPTLDWIDDRSRVIFTYRGNISLVSGEAEFRENPAVFLASTEEEDDVAYYDHELQAGIGLDVYGFRPVIGIYTNFLWGGVDDDILASQSDDDLEFGAFNSGLYAELGYRAPRFPLHFGARGLVGDVEGFMVFAGATF